MTLDADTLTVDKIIEVIGKAGFKSSAVKTEESATTAPLKPWKAPVPESAPKYFKEAFARARESGKSIVLDFSANWCAPCVRLKKETLEAPAVKDALVGVELIFVDLDAHPSLAKAYGVKSIPDVFFVSKKGLVVDRLRNFEGAGLFLQRLKKLDRGGRSGF